MRTASPLGGPTAWFVGLLFALMLSIVTGQPTAGASTNITTNDTNNMHNDDFTILQLPSVHDRSVRSVMRFEPEVDRSNLFFLNNRAASAHHTANHRNAEGQDTHINTPTPSSAAPNGRIRHDGTTSSTATKALPATKITKRWKDRKLPPEFRTSPAQEGDFRPIRFSGTHYYGVAIDTRPSLQPISMGQNTRFSVSKRGAGSAMRFNRDRNDRPTGQTSNRAVSTPQTANHRNAGGRGTTTMAPTPTSAAPNGRIDTLSAPFSRKNHSRIEARERRIVF